VVSSKVKLTLPSGLNLELFDHPEAHDVAAEVRILDQGEDAEHLVRGRSGHCNGMFTGT